ncbi:hypothetical protein OSTOST_16385, partial [Ostertagia ostertagi]
MFSSHILSLIFPLILVLIMEVKNVTNTTDSTKGYGHESKVRNSRETTNSSSHADDAHHAGNATNGSTSATGHHREDLIFLAKQIVDKLNQPWNHFVCAETSNGHCKVSDSIQICSYGRGLVVVMGMPLWFNETEKSELGRIHKWITDC